MPHSPIRWELLTAGGLMIAYLLTHCALTDSDTPYLMARSPFAFAFDIILLAATFGLSVSIVRDKTARGRFAGIICLVLSSILLLDWLHLLLNLRTRWRG